MARGLCRRARGPRSKAPLNARTATVLSIAILVVLGVVTVHNAFSYPSIGGYDALEYLTYARGLVDHGSLPAPGVGAYYTPPGFMAIAGLAGNLGRSLGMTDPDHLGQLVNAIAAVATGVLVFFLARTLWPSRPVVWLAATGFFAFFPTVVKTSAMFHPEPLGMLIAAGACLVLARMVRTRSYSWKIALGLGILLGAGQLVRAWSLWMVAVAAVVLAAIAYLDRSLRRSALIATAVALSAAVIIPSPWYVHQATRLSNPVFDRPQEDRFVLLRRPVAFYLDAHYPDVIFHPWKDHFNRRFIGLYYAETWGDYNGIWSWGPGRSDRTDAIDASLRRQSIVGMLPTALALAGLIALLGLSLARPREDVARLVVVLPPIAATLSVLYLGVAFPTTDGDTVKGTYALAAVPAFAVCFGFAVDVLARRRVVGVVLAVALVASAVAVLPFLVW